MPALPLPGANGSGADQNGSPTPAPPASPNGSPDPYNYGNPKRDFSYIEFNPPINRFTSGAYVDVNKNNESHKPLVGRNVIMGPDDFATRRLDKGVIYQDTDTTEVVDGTTSWGVTNPSYEKFNTMGKNRYGFRFHYNPSTIDYSIKTDNSTIDPALYLSGMTRAMPIATASLPVISFSLVINRIEDIAALQKNGWALRDQEYFYGRRLTPEEKFGIVTRGTGYDLEYLFRTMLGRPYVTDLRGTTADIGVAFGLPLILDFSPKGLDEVTRIEGKRVPTTSHFGMRAQQHGLRYWGRITGVSYTHREFDREMVPMFTEVSIEFARFPDAKGSIPEVESSDTEPGSSTPNTNAGNPPKNPGAQQVVDEAAIESQNQVYVPPNGAYLDLMDPGMLPSGTSGSVVVPRSRYSDGWDE